MSYSEELKDEGMAQGAAIAMPESAGDNVLLVSGDVDPRRVHTELRLSNGQVLRIPTSHLFEDGNGEDFRERPVERPMDSTTQVVPVIEEQLEVGKRTVVTGTVRLEKQVQEYHEALDVPLAVRTYDIERVVLNQSVEVAPPVRQEGETTIYPLVEEQLVLTKRLILKEELRVTRRDTERTDNRTVTLTRETMVVTRTPGSSA